MNDKIKQFMEVYDTAYNSLQKRELDSAKENYLKLIDLYRDIALSSEFEDSDKEIAHEQLLKIYYMLQKPPRPRIPLVAIVVLGIIILAFFFVKPTIVGLYFFPEKFVMDARMTIEKSGFYNVTLKGIPSSLKMSGEFSGEGKIYLVKGKNLLRVVQGSGAFEQACADSCKISGIEGTTITLLVEAKGPVAIDKIFYEAKPPPNNAPKFIGTETKFTVADVTKLNLSQMFTDEDKEDSLTYLATTADDLYVTVDNDQLIISKEKTATGTREITVIASDMKDVIKQKFEITLQ